MGILFDVCINNLSVDATNVIHRKRILFEIDKEFLRLKRFSRSNDLVMNVCKVIEYKLINNFGIRIDKSTLLMGDKRFKISKIDMVKEKVIRKLYRRWLNKSVIILSLVEKEVREDYIKGFYSDFNRRDTNVTNNWRKVYNRLVFLLKRAGKVIKREFINDQKGITLVVQNVRGLSKASKKKNLEDVIKYINGDIILLQETRTNKFNVLGYNNIILDPTDTRGGLMFLVKNRYFVAIEKYHKCKLDNDDGVELIEIIDVTFKVRRFKDGDYEDFRLINVYVRSGEIDLLEDYIKGINDNNLIIAGDFNIDIIRDRSMVVNIFKRIIADNNFKIVNNMNTRYDRRIDYILSRGVGFFGCNTNKWIDSDHSQIVGNIKAKLKIKKEKFLNVKLLENFRIRKEYESNLMLLLMSMEDDLTIDDYNRSMIDKINRSAEDIIGYKELIKNKFPRRIIKELKKRKNETDLNKIKVIDNNIRRIRNELREIRIVRDIESYGRITPRFWNRIRFFNNKWKEQKKPFKNDVIRFYSKLFFKEMIVDEIGNIEYRNENVNEIFSVERIKRIIDDKPNRKCPGPDGITYELLKKGPSILYEKMKSLFIRIYIEGIIPSQWKVGVLKLLYKSGDEKKAANYRPLTMIDTIAKVFMSLLQKRFVDEMENMTNKEQYGFKRGKGPGDQVRNLYMKLKNNRSIKIVTTIDIRKAFDSIDREILVKLLLRKNLYNLARMVKEYYRDNYLLYEGEKILVMKGVRQGDPLSPLLFNLYIEEAIKDVNGMVLAFADDLLLLNKDNAQKDIDMEIIINNLKEIKLDVNNDKTRSIEVRSVESIKYLGVFTKGNLSMMDHLKYVEDKFLKRLNKIKWLLVTNNISVHNKMVIYKTMLRSILFYGWCSLDVLKGYQREKMGILEKKVLKMILGVGIRTRSCGIYLELGLISIDEWLLIHQRKQKNKFENNGENFDVCNEYKKVARKLLRKFKRRIDEDKLEDLYFFKRKKKYVEEKYLLKRNTRITSRVRLANLGLNFYGFREKVEIYRGKSQFCPMCINRRESMVHFLEECDGYVRKKNISKRKISSRPELYMDELNSIWDQRMVLVDT